VTDSALLLLIRPVLFQEILQILRAPKLALRLIFAALALAFAAAALAQSNAKDDDDDDDDQPPPANMAAAPAKDDASLPLQDLTEPVLLGLLVAEIAAQRDSSGYAAQTYVDLAKRTRDPRIARRSAEIANYARLPNLALESAKIWYDAEPGSILALQTVSGLLIGARRVEEAEPYLVKLFASTDVAATNGFMQINRFLASNPDKPGNLAIVRKLATGYPSLPQAHFAVAQAAAATDNDALALEEVRRASQLKPDWDLPAIFEAQLLQAKAPAEAQSRLGTYLEKYPGSREAGLNYARLLVLDKKIPEARTQFQSLLKAFPDSPEVLYSVGLLSVQMKDYDAGETYLSRLLQTRFRDKDGVRFTLGQLAEEKKDFPGALKWYSQIESGQQFIPSRLRYAQILSKQGKLDEAREYLRKVDAGEQQTQMLIAEAQLLREANQNGEAFKILNQALEAQPDQPDLLYDHALTAEKLERFDVLEADLTRLIKIRPDNAHAYNALGYSFADRNIRLEEARKLIEKAIILAPEDLFIVDSLGWTFYRMGDYPKAIETLRRAWNGRPDGEIGAHLGEVLWVSGDRAGAENIWQEAIKNAPDNEALQKTIKRFKP
jgi:tetratricopeptide (TPR) repeat protein